MSEPILLRTKPQIEQEILDDWAVSLGVTDKEMGSDAKLQASTIARIVFALYVQLLRGARSVYIDTVPEASLELRGQDYSLPRRDATRSAVTLRFTVSGATTIPSGTVAKAPATTARDEIQFQTTVAATPSGAGDYDVPAVAVVAGSAASQLSAGTINTMVSTVANVTAVTNPASSTESFAREDVDTYRARLKAHLASLSRGTYDAILSAALNFAKQTTRIAKAATNSQTYLEVEDIDTLPFSAVGTNKLAIRSAPGGSIVEIVSYTGIDVTTTPHQFSGVTRGIEGTTATTHEPGAVVEEWIPDEYTSWPTSVSMVETKGNVDLYIDDHDNASGPHEQLRSLVEKRLRGDHTRWEADPGVKAAGITLNVFKRATTAITYEFTIQVEAGYSPSEVISDVQEAVNLFTNRLPVGHDLYAEQALCAALDVAGCRRVTLLKVNGVTYDGAIAADVAIATSAVARTTVGSITVNT